MARRGKQRGISTQQVRTEVRRSHLSFPVSVRSLSRPSDINRSQQVVSENVRGRVSDVLRRDIRDLHHVTNANLRRRVAYVARRILDTPSRVLRHDCRKEYSRLLSWRSARSAGGTKRRRSQKELRNDRRNFKRKDC